MSIIEKIIQYIFVVSVMVSMFISIKTSYDVHQQKKQITDIQTKLSVIYEKFDWIEVEAIREE